KVLPRAERRKFLGAFEIMYKHLQGSRAAVYPTAKKDARSGALVGVAILDIADPDTVLAQVPEMVAVANKAAPRAREGSGIPAPKFPYEPKAETIDGTRIDFLTVTLPGLKEADEREVRRLFGPDWNKLRMAVLGKKVVVLLGSDKGPLRETLANLKKG